MKAIYYNNFFPASPTPNCKTPIMTACRSLVEIRTLGKVLQVPQPEEEAKAKGPVVAIGISTREAAAPRRPTVLLATCTSMQITGQDNPPILEASPKSDSGRTWTFTHFLTRRRILVADVFPSRLEIHSSSIVSRATYGTRHDFAHMISLQTSFLTSK